MDKLNEARKLMAQAGVRHAEAQSEMADDLLKMFPQSVNWTKADVMGMLDDEYHRMTKENGHGHSGQ